MCDLHADVAACNAPARDRAGVPKTSAPKFDFENPSSRYISATRMPQALARLGHACAGVLHVGQREPGVGSGGWEVKVQCHRT